MEKKEKCLMCVCAMCRRERQKRLWGQFIHGRERETVIGTERKREVFTNRAKKFETSFEVALK